MTSLPLRRLLRADDRCFTAVKLKLLADAEEWVLNAKAEMDCWSFLESQVLEKVSSAGLAGSNRRQGVRFVFLISKGTRIGPSNKAQQETREKFLKRRRKYVRLIRPASRSIHSSRNKER